MSYLKMAIPLAISALLLFLVFRGTDPELFLSAWGDVDYGLTLLALILVCLGYFLKYWRWKQLIRIQIDQVTGWPVFSAMSLGILLDQFVPGKVGEVVRAHLVGRRWGVSRLSIFGSVVVERLFDLLSVLIIATLAIAAYGAAQDLMREAATLAALVIGGVAVIALLFFASREAIYAIIRKVTPECFSGRLVAFLERLSTGFLSVRHWRRSGLALLGGWGMWACLTASVIPLMMAMNFQPMPPWHTALILIPITVIGVGIPTVPGGMGIFEYAAVLALSLTAPSLETDMKAQVAVFALLYHVVMLGPELAAGLFCLNREFKGESFAQALRRLRASKEVVQAAEEG